MGFILDTICDSIRRRRIAKNNQHSRNITHYQPSQVGGFVETNSCFENTLISGGDAQIRSEAINALCISAANAGQPVIILHQQDTVCENALRATFRGVPNFYLVNRSNPGFDPIFGLSEHQIVNAILNTAPKTYRITPDGGAYISALTGTLATKSRRFPLPSIYSLIRNNDLPRLLQGGLLPSAAAFNIQTLYSQGQKEIHSVNQYISALIQQSSPVLPRKLRDYQHCCTLNTVIGSNGILVLDVISDMNNLYLRLLAELIHDFIRQGKRLLVIVDDLSITEENGLKAFLSSQSQALSRGIASKDLFASCCCEDKLFSSLLGISSKWFVFHHMSADSATQWSKGFGMYEKLETSVNVGRGYGSGYGGGAGAGGGHFGYNTNNQYNTGESIFRKDEARVRPYEIEQLGPRQGFVYTKSNNELAYISSFIP